MSSVCKFSTLKKRAAFNPILVEFQNGDILDEDVPQAEVKLEYKGGVKDVEIACQDGQVFKTNSINGMPLSNMYVAVKRRNKIHIIASEYVTLINAVHLKTEEIIPVEMDSKKQSEMLKRMFGTKRSIRQLETRDILNLDKGVMDMQLKEAISDMKISDISLEVEESSCLSLMPPCNREADVITDVYRIQDCLTAEELASLSSGVKEVLGTSADSKQMKFSDYFKGCLDEAMKVTNGIEERLACLIYAECLINYVKLPSKEIKKTVYCLCPYSKSVNSRIISEFCVKSGYLLQRPLMMRDKTMCYILVLSLIATNFKINLENLAKTVNLGLKKMSQLARAVGAVPVSKGSNEYILKLPLPPPLKPVSIGGKKKFSQKF